MTRCSHRGCFKAKQITTTVPERSLAALGIAAGVSEIQHPAGVWNAREPVLESAVFSEYHDMTLSLLIFSPHGPVLGLSGPEEDQLMDTFDAFRR